jgi:hypothetical protein
MAFDDREYLREELLIEADMWHDLFKTETERQADEIRRSLDHIVRLKCEVDLTPFERWTVEQTVTALRARLNRLRAAGSSK